MTMTPKKYFNMLLLHFNFLQYLLLFVSSIENAEQMTTIQQYTGR